MGKISLIIKREFNSRVRKKSFILLTLLGPILLAAIMILPAYIATLPTDEKVVLVLDPAVLLDFDKGKEELKFNYLDPKVFDLKKAKDFLKESGHFGLLYIPTGEGFDPDFMRSKIKFYSEDDLSLSYKNYIETRLESYLQKEKLKAEGVDPEILARSKTRVSLQTVGLGDQSKANGAVELKMAIGYIGGFLIYLFIFLYGTQVLRGVIEEKTNRVVEIMVSSVKPFQLMLGKIIGIGGVALLQFIIWIVFGLVIYMATIHFFIGDALNSANLNIPGGAAIELSAQQEFAFDLQKMLASINFPLIIISFICYFIGGYLLYGALLAAVGSMVDKEADSQQFMLPISLPLIASLIVLFRALDNPEGPLAFWFSLVPFSSPIIMMARIPFGVNTWEIALSLFILIITFLGLTWVAAKIYRSGILLYGKKLGWKDLLKSLK